MTTSRTLRLWLAGEDPAFATAIAAATESAFHGSVEVRRLAGWPPAEDTATDAPELLAWCDPSPEQLAEARAVLDASGLPRWGVVVFGDPADAALARSPYVLARALWSDTALVARVLAAATDGHALLRENARLRGDLRTFGHRVAHDLRTPLGGVLTTAEMLAEILALDSPPNAPLVQPIVESAEGLVRTIERMSFFAKALSSHEAPQLLDMGSVFWNAYQQLEGKILAAGGSLTHARDWPKVQGHAPWLEAVWRNLILNAVQHGGPAVRIEAGWSPEGAANRFWLCDSGRVAEARRASLWVPFHQRSGAGSPHGLGLAMVERLVSLEGGRCGFETRSDGSSCFYFVLPVADA